ncbi:MAG: hypothetical protein ACLP1X_20260 [Polyangiaceae bacterium]
MSRGAARAVSGHALVGAGALAFAVVALVAFTGRYHEFWRDEVHQQLLAANIPLYRFFLTRRVEGVPTLLGLFLKAFATVMPLHASLLLGGGIGYGALLCGTYRCVLSISRRPTASLVVTAVLAGTYMYAYEYGVMMREYGLGAGLGLATNGYLREALRGRSIRPVVLGTVTGALCACTGAHALTLAGGAFAAFGVMALWRDRGVRRIWPMLGALPFFALALYLALPFPGRTSEANVDAHRPAELFTRYAVQAISGSFTTQDWWVTASFGDPHVLDLIARLRHWGVIGIAIGVVYSTTLRLVPDWSDYRPILLYDLLAVVIGWLPLLEIVVNHYWGSPRHHGFFALPVLALLAGWGLQRGGGTAPWASAGALALLVPWFAYQYIVCVRDLDLEVRLPFSDTKEAAALVPPRAHLVVESLTMQEAFMFWQPTLSVRGADNGGRHLGAIAPDPAWNLRVPIVPLVREECAAAPDATYYSGAAWGVQSISRCLKLLRTATPHSEQTRADERMDVWRVDCACVTAAGTP